MPVDRSYTYTLANDVLEVTVSVIGASIVSFKARVSNNWVDIMPPASDSLSASSFLMVPYSNRIRNGELIMNNQSFKLSFPEKHAIHGDVRNRPWFCCRTSPKNKLTYFCFKFDSADIESRTSSQDWNWPYRISCCTEFTLDKNTLTQKVSIQNLDRPDQWIGGGFHPYFCRHGAEPKIEFSCKGIYPGSSDVPTIPAGPPQPIPSDLDFHTAKPFQKEMDYCYSGFDGHASILYPDLNMKVSIQTSPNVKHFIAYNPMDKPFFALEPVVNANDAFNLMKNFGIDSGLFKLAHNETLTFEMSITVDTL
ncbi:hypothetical protein GEMRC1_005839 [Eukaryota sp. GEM-RC1]